MHEARRRERRCAFLLSCFRHPCGVRLLSQPLKGMVIEISSLLQVSKLAFVVAAVTCSLGGSDDWSGAGNTPADL